MKNQIRILVGMLIVVTSIFGCTVPNTLEPADIFETPPENVSSESVPEVSQRSTYTSSPTAVDFSDTTGPLLLLQTGVDEYQFLNVSQNKLYPLNPAIPKQRYNLNANLSPSGTKMFFPSSEGKVLIMDLISQQIQATFNIEIESRVFQLEEASEIARPFFPKQEISQTELLTAINDALIQSQRNLQWFNSDRYHCAVFTGSETSTNLFLVDHQTGIRDQLEYLPGLVEDYWIGPTNNFILLKKSYIFDPHIWQDDRYYLVNIKQKSTHLIPLPENSDHPSVFWFFPNQIGIIHQTGVTDNLYFSLVDSSTKETQQVIQGSFTNLYAAGNQILTVHQQQETHQTTLALHSFDEAMIQTQKLESLCAVIASISAQRFLINCETESFLLTKSLQVNPFGEPILLVSTSPNGNDFILVTRPGKTTRFNEELQIQENLNLEESPLEILWLPDSSGFLYRTPLGLFLYDLQQASSQPLLKTNFFGDYSNLNAVWVRGN